MLRLVFFFCFSFLLSCNLHDNKINEREKYIEVKKGSAGFTLLDDNVRVFVSDKDTAKKKVITYWDNGNKQVISFFKNLMKDSCWSKYYENDTLLSFGCFKNGLKEGEFKYYFQNGKIGLVENYSAGRKVNEIRYDSLGIIQTEIPGQKSVQ